MANGQTTGKLRLPLPPGEIRGTQPQSVLWAREVLQELQMGTQMVSQMCGRWLTGLPA
jgi:hypothetical protein